MELQLEDTTPAPIRIEGLWSKAVRDRLRAEIASMETVVGVAGGADPPGDARCGEGGPARARIGLALGFDYGLIDAEGRPQVPGKKLRSGQLHFAVTAHVERLGEDGRPEIAEATPHGAVPLPARRARELARFAAVRLIRAARLATGDALGQLWVRHLSDARVLTLLRDRDLWRRAAAIREAGERSLAAGREAIEEAAGDSRRDVAVVAAAALGRLGDPRSVPALEACLGHRNPEVIDAALGALADMPGPEARALLEAATRHPHPWIRQRARSLLER